METALGGANWEAALRAVERNAGAPGPDGMKARELREHLAKHGEGIKAKLLKGSFKPSPARRKEIPKPNGGTRPLSIPNVLDRFVQQLLLQVMQPLFEPGFSESSHGFRPRRSAHGAIEAAQRQAREGRDWVVDIDITKFFDHVNHDILMTQVSRVLRDKRVLQLILAVPTSRHRPAGGSQGQHRGRHPARRPALPSAGQHLSGQTRQGTGTPRTQARPLR